MSDPVRALKRVSRALSDGGFPHMVVGGMAAILWGEARTTRDIDITVLVDDAAIGDLIACIGGFGSARIDDAVAFALAHRVVPAITDDAVPVDLILATLPFEVAAIERAQPITIEGVAVPHVSPADLVVHKVVSTRAIDWEDVVAILSRQHDLDIASLRDLVARLAVELAETEILHRFHTAVRDAGR